MVRGRGWSRYAMATLISTLILPATPARAQGEPASGTDLEFVRRVHVTAAGVSAATALARQLSTNNAIKQLASRVDTQNDQLDDLSRSTAGALEVPLADPVPADLRTALATMQDQSGTAFDAGYVRYLWQADSVLLPISTTVCATTRSAAVHRLAERADAIVAAQLPMLMKSGLLDMAVLPSPAPPGTAAGRLPGGVPRDQPLMAQTRSGAGFLSPGLPVRVGVLVGATGIAAAAAWHLRSRSRSGRRRGRHHGRPRADRLARSR